MERIGLYIDDSHGNYNIIDIVDVDRALGRIDRDFVSNTVSERKKKRLLSGAEVYLTSNGTKHFYFKLLEEFIFDTKFYTTHEESTVKILGEIDMDDHRFPISDIFKEGTIDEVGHIIFGSSLKELVILWLKNKNFDNFKAAVQSGCLNKERFLLTIARTLHENGLHPVENLDPMYTIVSFDGEYYLIRLLHDGSYSIKIRVEVKK